MDWVSVEMSSNFARSKCLFHRLSRILLFVVVFFTTPNHNSCQEEEVDAKNLHRFLTPPEWQSYFGNSGKVPLFDVVRLPHRTRRKRSASGEHLRLQALGEDFDFTLWPTPGLLDDNFVMLNRNENGTDILPEDLSEEQHCFYQGLVRHRSQDTNRSQEDPVAVGLCGGMRGLIASKNHYYVINPLPHRFRKRSADPEDELLPHVMVRKSHPRNDCHNRHVPGKRRRKRGSLFPSVYYSGSSTVKHTKPPPGARLYIETAVYVDKDLYNLMEVNFPKDTKREIIRVVLAMVNAVQLLYQDPSLGRPVDYVLKRLEILQSDPSSLERSPDIDNFLTSFCRWQREMNPASDSDPNHWDHALILTGLDLYVRSKNGKISKQVVGLAPVAGMCTRMSSCTVNEGRHFESVYVVAHEIGHNLGMRHDGPLADNECDPGSYIMSPTLGSGKITWSSCSRRYLEAFLETPQSRCLLDHSAPVPEFDHSREGRLPGERFDADEQCILKYGRGSYHAPQQPLDDVCRDLHCRRDRYTWTSHPALEGTYCGSGMWCRSGRCVTRGLSALQAGYVPNQRVDGSWSEWTPFSECASGCLYGSDGSLSSGSTGIMVSTRRCNKPRPENGGRQCQGHDRRFRACNAVQQCVSVPKTTVIRFADEVCERAREVDSELLGTGLQRASSDPQEACTVWCYKRNGGSKSRGWTFPDGTSCQLRSSRYGKSWYCINGKCEEFSCDKFGTATFSNAQERCPFERTRDSSLFAREWSAWAAGSLCRFNCVAPGRGLRLVQRECQTSNCIGSTSSIQLCEPEKAECPRLKTPFEHASAICSKYSERVRRLSGLGMQISPSLEDPDRPCRVACQDEKVTYRFYLVNGEDGWFPFGTDCGRGVTGKKAYCLSGRCMDFGDDDTPLHKNDYLLHPAHFLFKRSVLPNFTRITHSLDQEELDDIIDRLDLNGQRSGQNLSYPRFLIDWNNPIHIEEDDTDMEELNNVVSPSDFQFKPRKQKNHKLYDLNNISSQGYLTATDEYSTSSRKCTRDGRYHMDNTECSNSALSAANDAAASSRVLCSHSLIMFLPLISHLLNLTQKLLKLTLS